MGTKYSSQTVSGYNAAPPPDDGSQISANKISWATIKTKLPDPILTLAQAINTTLLTSLDVSNTAKAVNYTTLSSDHLKPIEVSSGAVIHLADAAVVGVGYQATVVNTDLALSSTVDLANATNTLDGNVAGSVTLAAGQSITVAVSAAVVGYYTVQRGWSRNGFIVSEVVRFDASVNLAQTKEFNLDGSSGTNFGRLSYTSGSNTALLIDNAFDDPAAEIRLRTRTLGTAVNALLLNATSATFAGTVSAPASASGGASLRLPHGAAPSAPINGDMWTTTSGLFVRINGVTVGPLT